MLALADTKLALDEQVSAEAAVSGELAGNIDIDEGNEGIIEKKVKTSLMSTLQKRFDGGEIEIPDEEAAKSEDVKMEGAEDAATPTATSENGQRKTAAAAKGAAGRMKFKIAPKREKPKLDDDGEEIKEENGDEDEDEDDALSSVASDAGSEYEES